MPHRFRAPFQSSCSDVSEHSSYHLAHSCHTEETALAIATTVSQLATRLSSGDGLTSDHGQHTSGIRGSCGFEYTRY